MNALAPIPTSILPAPLSHALDTAVTVATNKLDQEGLGFSIAAEDAPSPEAREALERRVHRLSGAMQPIGERGAAAQVMTLKLTLETKARSDAEAEGLLDLYVKNLADLPTFAVIAACQDYQQLRAGDGKWMPKVPELRARAMVHVGPVQAERIKIERVLNARVRPSPCGAERKARVMNTAREVASRMRFEGQKAEAERAGKIIDDPALRPSEPPEAVLERLRAAASAPIAPLSDGARQAFRIAQADPSLRSALA